MPTAFDGNARLADAQTVSTSAIVSAEPTARPTALIATSEPAPADETPTPIEPTTVAGPAARNFSVLNRLTSSSNKESPLMKRLAEVTYEPALTGEAIRLIEHGQNPANDEFDEALAQVASGLNKKGGTRAAKSALDRPAQEDRAGTAAAAVAGSAAVVAAAYELVIKPPDDPKRQPGWFARFPRL